MVEFRRAKKDYETDVMFAMYEITSHPVGQALIAEFDMTPSQIVGIHPWGDEEDANSSASADDVDSATSVGMPKLDTRGQPNARSSGSGTGEGSDATVKYTASMWGADGTARATGPGTGKDELLLHELVTNAAKFGALSTAAGSLSLTWSITREQQILFDWREEGGPPPPSDRKRGFGSDLIEKVISRELRSDIKLQFSPSGVRCTFLVPIRLVGEFVLRKV